ncbi:MAG: hypothetical protein HOV80_01765 [Polyangiaceae bacterium]|nr:hypothetical protein [Polyangiaceae bacterium]
MSDRRFLPCVFVLALSAFLFGCPGKQVITETPTVEGAEEQQATCKVAKDPLNPLIVEWPGTSKVDLDSSSQRSVVIVSYAGCTLKVLTSCHAKQKKGEEVDKPYDLTSVTPARDKLQIADQSELYARLPLGAASLKGELSLGSSLELDYIAVGQRVAAKAPEELTGDCDGATHFIRTITVGAYSLDVMAKGKAGASVDVGNAGAGVGREESRRNLRGSGDVDACSKDPLSKDCGAVLQLGLAPLQREGEKLLNNAGFGAGLGPTGNVYIPNLDNLNTSSASFRNVDSAYFKLVDTAMSVEKQKGTPATEKVRAWEKVRDHKKEGEFFEQAEERVGEWEKVADAEQRRREALDKLRETYLEDKSKLDELLAIQSDQLATPAQKTAWRKEFDVAYAPHQKDLEELGLRSSTGGSGSGSGSGSGTGNDTSTPVAEKQYAIGTPIGLEAEFGYARFGGNVKTGGTESEPETAYVLGGDGIVAGANLGFPNLGAGFGLMATFRAYQGLQEPSGTALAFGGQLRWSVGSELAKFEIAGGGGYALYVTEREVDEGTFNKDLNNDNNIDEDHNFLLSAAGATIDLTLGVIFNIDVLVFGARAGLNISGMNFTATKGGKGGEDVERIDTINTTINTDSEASVGPLFTAMIGVQF